MIQGSDEWFKARCGVVTASRIADLTAKTKTGWGANRANYMAQLIAERLTGQVQESYSNAAMQWGTETEPQARAAYEFFSGETVEEVGFILHPSIEIAGASPDGRVGDSGLVEIKCPNTATHIDTLIKGKIPAKYIKQMQWQIACEEREWCDFVSFDPRMPVNNQLFVKRIDRDSKMIEELESMVLEFISEMNDKIKQLTET